MSKVVSDVKESTSVERFGHIGDALRYYRAQSRMTQEELAQAAWLSPGHIVRLENKEVRVPRLETVQNLEIALGLTNNELSQFVIGPPTMPAGKTSIPDFLRLTAVYEHTEDGWWVVSVPEIPGAHSQGRTLEEAREMIKDAVRMLVDVRREDAEREAGEAGREVIREPLEV